MANLDDVRRIVSSLPETAVDDSGMGFSVKNKGKHKGIAWVWLERADPKKARVPNPQVLAVRVRDLQEKDMFLAVGGAFFTEPHYNGFPAILVRLAAVGAGELEELLTNAWRCQAPRDLVKRFDQEQGR
jgi:hypothetical protein